MSAEFYLRRVKEQIDYIEEVKKRDCDEKRKEEVLVSAIGQLNRMYEDLGAALYNQMNQQFSKSL